MGVISTGARRRALLTAGSRITRRIAMIAIATRISIRVKAFERGLDARRMFAPRFRGMWLA